MPVSAAAQIQAEDATIRLGFEAPGQLRNLRWEAHAPVQPGEDEIEVEVKASGLNFRDVMYAQGLLSDEAIENGFAGATLGLEFAGIVLRTGSRVQHYAAGDAVLGFGPASFANRVITKDSALTHLPAGISFEAAATIPTVFFTVYYALHHLARLAAGEKILIHGAAGGVGIAAIQFAQWIGAEIHATAGSEAKRDFLRLLGVDYIYDSRSLDFADQVLANTQGQGVDVVLNSLAGEAIRRNFDVLKPFGRFLELGKRDFYENTHIGLRPFRNNISYFGIDADQLMQANPALTRKLFTEMMALFAQGEFYPLPYQVFEADQVVDAFRFMQQARQIGKVVVTYRNGFGDVLPARPQALSTLSLSSDATYLVTGGLAGFGLSTAEWLAEKGARHLVLISRRGPVFSNPGDEARAALDRLVASGVAVHAAAVDVTDAQAVARLLEHVRANMPPVKGIVHAAAVIEDALVRNLDADKIRKVLAPKIQGALNLHAATQDLPLDFFVMFSSATTLFGNPGQSAYIAANSFLEGFAEMRRKAGLPATCVRWGPIDDVGFLARNSQIKEALQSRMGGSAVSAATAMNVLEKMLLADQSGLAVMELDWRALSRFLPAAQAQKYRELAAHAPQDEYQAEAVDDIRQMLAGLQGAALHGAVINLLKREVAEILRLAPEKIDVNRSLYDIGMDSLMGMELMLALENSFGVHLPVMALAESPTLTRLTERVVETLQGEGTAGNEAADQIAQLAAQHGVAVDQTAIAELAESMRDADPNSVLPAQAGIQLVGLTFMNPERRPG
jgi:NADPH:quinone reductase-like Zn-dependent oxidoreductase/NAD(P)-dependent dehydrogenase (short-subunit alcohol dehydrogenase family)